MAEREPETPTVKLMGVASACIAQLEPLTPEQRTQVIAAVICLLHEDAARSALQTYNESCS